MQRIDHTLPWGSLGSERTLSVFRFGPAADGDGSGVRKAYIQASLHADELPGMRVAWALKQRLRELEAAGQLLGTIELVPVANPIGLAQAVYATQQGRFELHSGANFNREFSDLAALVGERVAPQLSSDAAANTALIRQAMRQALADLPAAGSELAGLRRLLLTHACDADVVLDLHCDFESILLLYTLPALWPQVEPLARRLGAGMSLLAEDSGGGSFDEACSLPWSRLAQRFADKPIDMACVASTLELRGMLDTDPAQAAADAEAILAYLAEQGLLAGQWPALAAGAAPARPFAGADYLSAPHAGVVSFLKPLGAVLKAGEAVFEVVDPVNDRVSVVCCHTDGVLYARERLRYALPGLWLAKVAGETTLRHGRLLSD
ncbi:succinylglutamate desuccinylase/aspartoacylase family protein [Atopomonas sediminilitoris]|uniref:succinylglutamate desuccinylase/aspartoacylase family protein n=1 Tax=Atopomonas sediminilitoris TaxID=2919919 RepID=UPI001F4D499E|nr:succinylglutamate desuccinylase/aspartoacylase family protein [Atopomonas sediminilitoris]MCJ8170064.1 M14 family metallopeptidase [Atopomonas sediminilitoris]